MGVRCRVPEGQTPLSRQVLLSGCAETEARPAGARCESDRVQGGGEGNVSTGWVTVNQDSVQRMTWRQGTGRRHGAKCSKQLAQA